jgi:hypothetical protein
MNRVREMRGGKDYDASFGKRMRGEGIWADMIRQRFEKCVARLGLNVRSGRFSGLDGSHFRAPLSRQAPTEAASPAGCPDRRAAQTDGQFELF